MERLQSLDVCKLCREAAMPPGERVGGFGPLVPLKPKDTGTMDISLNNDETKDLEADELSDSAMGRAPGRRCYSYAERTDG